MSKLTLQPTLVPDVFETVEIARQPLNHNHIVTAGEPAAVYVARSKENNGSPKLYPPRNKNQTPVALSLSVGRQQPFSTSRACSTRVKMSFCYDTRG